MKKLYLSIILISLSVSSACSSQDNLPEEKKDVQEIVVIDDGYKTTDGGEILFDDANSDGLPIDVKGDNKEEPAKILEDGSSLKILYDGYGNKTITRFFNNHPLISGIVSRNSVNGETKTFIYTKDGLVKTVSEDYKDLIFTASADELAKSADVRQLNKEALYRPSQQQPLEQKMSVDVATDTYVADVDRSNVELDQTPKADTAENKQIPEPKVKEATNTIAENTFLNEFESKVIKTGKAVNRRKSKAKTVNTN